MSFINFNSSSGTQSKYAFSFKHYEPTRPSNPRKRKARSDEEEKKFMRKNSAPDGEANNTGLSSKQIFESATKIVSVRSGPVEDKGKAD